MRTSKQLPQTEIEKTLLQSWMNEVHETLATGHLHNSATPVNFTSAELWKIRKNARRASGSFRRKTTDCQLG